MKIAISGKNIDLTNGLKEAVEDRLKKLEKYFQEDTPVQVTLSVDKERQKVEITIPIKGTVIRAEQVSNDMYVSIEVAVETIERQLVKHRKKLVTKQQSADKVFAPAYIENVEENDDNEIQIVRSKRFGIKPMYPEDACMQMDLLGHDFFVFLNADTEEVNVVYKRKGNTYGLIEPEF